MNPIAAAFLQYLGDGLPELLKHKEIQMAMQEILQQLMAAKGAHEEAIAQAQADVKTKSDAVAAALTDLKTALDKLATIPPA